MADTLLHRGPDESDVWVSAEAPVALGHTRLAVVDLSPTGHQPMTSSDGRWVLAFNGEIYNHESMRRDLGRLGTSFRGRSDTEVLLTGMSTWGLKETLERADGMFAIAAWDAHEQVLHLVRDRMGEKPLYYGWSGSAFVFGSELRALRAWPGFSADIDRESVALMLQGGYVPGPRSIYRDARKLQPGRGLSVSLSGPPEEAGHWSYWDIQALAGDRTSRRSRESAAEAIARCDALLTDVVARELVADVPVGALLSGGIDSSLVVALAQRSSLSPVRTFTVGFTEPDYDESAYARAVAKHLGTDHTEVIVTPDDALAVIPELPAIYDEPFADSSQIPTVLISRIARQAVTVSLTGDGGDELFGGYQRYGVHGAVARIGSVPLPLRRGAASLIDRVPDSSWATIERSAARWPIPGGGRRLAERVHKGAALLATPDVDQQAYAALMTQALPEGGNLSLGAAIQSPFLNPDFWDRNLDRLGRMRLVDQLIYLPDDLLVKVDRAAMSVSLETRAPLLSREVVEFAWGLPRPMLRRRGSGKWILKKVLERYVPQGLFDRPKMGFGVPLGSWLRGPLREWGHHLISEVAQDTDALLDPGYCMRMWQRHVSGESDHSYLLWNVLMFQAWREKYR